MATTDDVQMFNEMPPIRVRVKGFISLASLLSRTVLKKIGTKQCLFKHTHVCTQNEENWRNDVKKKKKKVLESFLSRAAEHHVDSMACLSLHDLEKGKISD